MAKIYAVIRLSPMANFVVQMIDRMTAPAKAVERAIGGVSKSLRSLNEASKAFKRLERESNRTVRSATRDLKSLASYEAMPQPLLKALFMARLSTQYLGHRVGQLGDKFGAAKGRINAVAGVIGDKIGNATQKAKTKLDNFGQGIATKLSPAMGLVTRMGERVAASPLGNAFRKALDVGGSVAQVGGYFGAIASAAGRLGVGKLMQVGGQAGRSVTKGLGAGIRAGGAYIKQNLSGALGSVKEVVSGAFGAAASFGGAAMGAFSGISQFAIGAAAAKQETTLALKYMLGSSEEAEKVYKLVQSMGDKTPLEQAQVLESFKKFKGAGFDMGEATLLISTMADLKNVASADQIGSFANAIAKIKSDNKLGGDALGTITDAIPMLSKGRIYEEIGKLKGFKETGDPLKKKVEGLLESGQVKATDGIQAIINAQKSAMYTGELKGKASGTAGDEAAKGIMTTYGNLKDNFSRIFENIDLGPLVSMINSVNEAFASPEGVAFKETVTAAFGEIFKGLGGGPGIADMFKTAIPIVRMLGNVIGKVILPLTGALAGGAIGGFVGALMPLLEVFNELAGQPEVMAAIKQSFQAAGVVIGVAIAMIVYGVTTIITIFGLLPSAATGLWGLISSIGAAVSGAASSLYSAGAAIMTGLWNGIKNGFTAFLGKFEGLIDLLPASAKKLLGIASPSKVFAQLGTYTVQGLVQGIDQGETMVARASASLANETTAGFASGGGSSGGSKAPVTLTVNLTVQSSDTPQSIRQAVKEAMASVLEQYSLEIGIALCRPVYLRKSNRPSEPTSSRQKLATEAWFLRRLFLEKQGFGGARPRCFGTPGCWGR